MSLKTANVNVSPFLFLSNGNCAISLFHSESVLEISVREVNLLWSICWTENLTVSNLLYLSCKSCTVSAYAWLLFKWEFVIDKVCEFFFLNERVYELCHLIQVNWRQSTVSDIWKKPKPFSGSVIAYYRGGRGKGTLLAQLVEHVGDRGLKLKPAGQTRGIEVTQEKIMASANVFWCWDFISVSQLVSVINTEPAHCLRRVGKNLKPKLNFLLFLIRKRDWSLCKRQSSTLILSLFVYTCVTMDKFKSLWQSLLDKICFDALFRGKNLL